MHLFQRCMEQSQVGSLYILVILFSDFQIGKLFATFICSFVCIYLVHRAGFNLGKPDYRQHNDALSPNPDCVLLT